jgi:hypothetical protein
MKKIKIKSHSNLQPFKNVEVRHSIWGFNEVSFEKNKNKKSFQFAALQERESATFHLGFHRGFL